MSSEAPQRRDARQRLREPAWACARRLLVPWLATGLLVAGCIGQSPEVQRELDLGPEEPGVRQGPEHRPGQPCLRCHGEEHTPGGHRFVFAGTVYQRPGDTEGVRGVAVDLEDARGRAHTARTNRAGNFYVPAGDFSPDFPLRVKIRSGDIEQRMQSLIWREGSCAECHGGRASAGSNGKIYLEREAP